NHCRATAAIGARLGMHVRLILRAQEKDPVSDGNLLLSHLFGAEVTYHPPDVYTDSLDELVKDATEAARNEGRKPYYFPVGASVPLGCWGYVRCIYELVGQLGRDTPLDIYCATSSGGTQVGLMLGKALASCVNWRIRG